MKTLLAVVFIFTLVLPTFTFAVENAEDQDTKVMTILVKNCAGCHNKENHPGALFLNQARLNEKQTLSLMEKLVRTSQMPPEHVSFRKSEDGKLLLAWLSNHKKNLKK